MRFLIKQIDPFYIVCIVFKNNWKFPISFTVSDPDENITLIQSKKKRYFGFPMVKKMIISKTVNISKLDKIYYNLKYYQNYYLYRSKIR